MQTTRNPRCIATLAFAVLAGAIHISRAWHLLASNFHWCLDLQAKDMDQGDSDFSAVLEAVIKQSN